MGAMTTTDRQPLTTRQAEVYRAILRHVARHGVPPSIRELGTALKISSPNGVMANLNALAKKGWLVGVGEDHKARQVMPVELAEGVKELARAILDDAA